MPTKNENSVFTWAELNKKLKTSSEEETLEIMKTAKKARMQPHFLVRIYGRYNKLRKDREIRELLR